MLPFYYVIIIIPLHNTVLYQNTINIEGKRNSRKPYKTWKYYCFNVLLKVVFHFVFVAFVVSSDSSLSTIKGHGVSYCFRHIIALIDCILYFYYHVNYNYVHFFQRSGFASCSAGPEFNREVPTEAS